MALLSSEAIENDEQYQAETVEAFFDYTVQ
jgi:hypothetical protein